MTQAFHKENKLAINFVWIINYAKWGEKTLKKIIQNYELEKQGLKTEKLNITDIIPNHGNNYDDWKGNVFYVQNIISHGMKFPENPVRIFTAFADSASLISFENSIAEKFRIFKDIFELPDLIREYEARVNPNFKSKVVSFFKKFIFFAKEENKNEIDLRDRINEIKELEERYPKDSEEFKDYLENKEFYDEFSKKVYGLIQSREFLINIDNDYHYDHEKINKLLIKFIQVRYKTDISLEKIKEEYKKTFLAFQDEFKTYNKNFEIIDLREAIKKDLKTQEDLKRKNDETNLHSKVLKLVLNDEIFEMINFVDSVKIFVNYYGFGHKRNLTIDMDITDKTLYFELENIVKNNKERNEILEKDSIYFGYGENQVCLTNSLHIDEFLKIFSHFGKERKKNYKYPFYDCALLVKMSYAREGIIKSIGSQSNMYSMSVSGISENIEVPMNNSKSEEKEREYEFKINWIQDGLKYDIEDLNEKDIKIDDVKFIQKTMGKDFQRK
jgi:hypothetical protein